MADPGEIRESLRGEKIRDGGVSEGSEGGGDLAVPAIQSFAPCCRPWVLPSLGSWAIKRKVTNKQTNKTQPTVRKMSSLLVYLVNFLKGHFTHETESP